MYLIDEGIRHAAQAESAGEKCRVGFHVFDCLGGGRENFVDFISAKGRTEISSNEFLVLDES